MYVCIYAKTLGFHNVVEARFTLVEFCSQQTYTYMHTYMHAYIQTDRQTDRQTDGHTARQTYRQTDRHPRMADCVVFFHPEWPIVYDYHLAAAPSVSISSKCGRFRITVLPL